MAKLTTYEGMNNASGMLPMEGEAIYGHLDASENNAAVVSHGVNGEAAVAIWNAPDMSGYWWAMLPLEDPNDAEFVSGRDPGNLVSAVFGRP